MTPASSAPAISVRLDEAPVEHELTFLDDQLDGWLERQMGNPERRVIACVARDEAGAIVGGVHGVTWGGCCELLTLWVADELRHNGLGGELLLAAEREAARRGCTQMILLTHTQGPPRLYQRLGYAVAGSVADYPAGWHTFLLRKSIDAAST